MEDIEEYALVMLNDTPYIRDCCYLGKYKEDDVIPNYFWNNILLFNKHKNIVKSFFTNKLCEDRKEKFKDYHFYDSLIILSKSEFLSFLLMKEIIE